MSSLMQSSSTLSAVVRPDQVVACLEKMVAYFDEHHPEAQNCSAHTIYTPVRKYLWSPQMMMVTLEVQYSVNIFQA